MAPVTERFQHLFSTLATVTRGLHEIADMPGFDQVISRAAIPTFKVVIVGDQSAGKSSLVERLCQITLPTDRGVCTRCAIEIRLTMGSGVDEGEGGNVSARANLDGPEPAQRYTIKYKAPGEPEVLIGTTTSSSEVHESVRRAQEALLSADPSTRDVPRAERFSLGLVIVEVANAPVNLTVVDLPGLIVLDPQHPGNARKIEQIVDAYLADPWNIVVAVASCTEQLATKAVFPALHNGDNHGRLQRTFGIVTKADLGNVGNPEEWRSLLTGADPMKRVYATIPQANWFIMATPNIEEQGFDKTAFDVNDEKERSFFKSTTMWEGIPDDKKGIENIRKALSDQLYSLMQEHVGEVRGAINTIERAVDSKLSALPHYTEVERAMREDAFESSVHQLMGAMRRDVLQGAPDSLVEGPEMREPPGATVKGLLRAMKDRMEDSCKPNNAGQESQGIPALPKGRLDNEACHELLLTVSKNLTPENLREVNEETQAPWNGSISDVKNLIAAAWIREWWKHVLSCLKDVRRVLEEIVERRVAEVIGSQYSSELEGLMRRALFGRLESCYRAAEKQLAYQQEMEFAEFFSAGRGVGGVFTVFEDELHQELAQAATEGGQNTDETASHECEVIRRLFQICFRRYADTAAAIIKHHLIAAFLRPQWATWGAADGATSLEANMEQFLQDFSNRVALVPPASPEPAPSITELLKTRKELECKVDENRRDIAKKQLDTYKDYIAELSKPVDTHADQRRTLVDMEDKLNEYRHLLDGRDEHTRAPQAAIAHQPPGPYDVDAELVDSGQH